MTSCPPAVADAAGVARQHDQGNRGRRPACQPASFTSVRRIIDRLRRNCSQDVGLIQHRALWHPRVLSRFGSHNAVPRLRLSIRRWQRSSLNRQSRKPRHRRRRPTGRLSATPAYLPVSAYIEQANGRDCQDRLYWPTRTSAARIAISTTAVMMNGASSFATANATGTDARITTSMIWLR